MRAYTIAVAALALDADAKWLDNLLSHHHVPGVARKKQGIQRKIPPNSLLIIAVARTLISSLQIPIAKALELAGSMIHAQDAAIEIPPVSLRCDLRGISSRLNDRLADAVEGAGNLPRGRPRAS